MNILRGHATDLIEQVDTEKYVLTEEHRAQLPAWRDKWIANAMRCTPMTEAEKDQARAAVKGLYRAGGLRTIRKVID